MTEPRREFTARASFTHQEAEWIIDELDRLAFEHPAQYEPWHDALKSTMRQAILDAKTEYCPHCIHREPSFDETAQICGWGCELPGDDCRFEENTSDEFQTMSEAMLAGAVVFRASVRDTPGQAAIVVRCPREGYRFASVRDRCQDCTCRVLVPAEQTGVFCSFPRDHITVKKL